MRTDENRSKMVAMTAIVLVVVGDVASIEPLLQRFYQVGVA